MKKTTMLTTKPSVSFAIACFLFTGMMAAPVSAQVDVGLDNVFIAPDGSVTMDIMISPTGAPQTMNNFDFTFLIDNSGATAGSRLEFVEALSTEAFVFTPSYVFSANSDAEDQNAPVNTLQPDTASPNDTIMAFDLTFDFLDIALNSEKLMTQLQFQHFAGGSPLATIGDTFGVSVDGFVDNIDGDIITVNAGSGSVTVAAIPEPGTFLACAAITSLVTMRRRRRSRQ